MEIFEALYTTRAMRRVRPDPIPMEVQQSILDAAVRAPTGGNMQGWRFMLVDDPGLKAKLGPLYRKSLGRLFDTVYAAPLAAAKNDPSAGESIELMKMMRSAQHLADGFEEIPLFLFAFIGNNDQTGGSIFPAVWSAMLAARGHGVGSALTSILSIFGSEETNTLLGVPSNEGWSCACAVSFGYPTGRWGVAPRRPVHEVSCRNGWNEPVGFEVPDPLWSK